MLWYQRVCWYLHLHDCTSVEQEFRMCVSVHVYERVHLNMSSAQADVAC